MIIIAHRGNVNGKNPQLENSVEYVQNAISLGFDVEVDVWWHENDFFLGHDFPQWKLKSHELLFNEKVWCHAKNLDAFEKLLNKDDCNCFWHQNDDVTLTSKGYVWTYPGKKLIYNSVCVVNDEFITSQDYFQLSQQCVAICSDYAQILREYEK